MLCCLLQLYQSDDKTYQGGMWSQRLVFFSEREEQLLGIAVDDP